MKSNDKPYVQVTVKAVKVLASVKTIEQFRAACRYKKLAERALMDIQKDRGNHVGEQMRVMYYLGIITGACAASMDLIEVAHD